VSVINQVLLNLERRRASSAERGLLPDHVQALPFPEPSHNWGWIVAGVALAVAAPAGWMALTATVADPVQAPATRPGTGRPAENVAAAVPVPPALVARPDEGEDAYARELRALRLSLDLSLPPAEPAPSRGEGAQQAALGGGEPISTARVVGRTGTESATDIAPAVSARSETGKRAAAAPAKPAAGAGATPEIRKHVRDPTPRERAENEYRKAVALLNQGRLAEAEEAFRAALDFYPENHQARHGLIGLLVQGKKLDEAERLMDEGVKLAPAQLGFGMMLARLQADRGDTASAIATLEKGLEHAQGTPDYLAFLAALLQRQGRHEEAIGYFNAALRLRPGTGVWWLGLGMSLQAVNQPAAAQSAYQQARAAGTLQPELAALAEQRLRQLQ
jgi:MSHA biogenesis protein MshN